MGTTEVEGVEASWGNGAWLAGSPCRVPWTEGRLVLESLKNTKHWRKPFGRLPLGVGLLKLRFLSWAPMWTLLMRCGRDGPVYCETVSGPVPVSGKHCASPSPSWAAQGRYQTAVGQSQHVSGANEMKTKPRAARMATNVGLL